jgi:membrane protein implicated in regulation of membrane protease activity
VSDWIAWAVLCVVLVVLEATTTAFVALYFAVAALATAVLAAIGLAFGLQLAAFGLIAIGGLLLTRPALMRAARRGPELRTGVDAMRGQHGLVTKAIADFDPGLVKVGGELWTARSYFEGEEIPEGARVEVVEVKGVTALVIPAPSPSIEERGGGGGN